MNDPECAYNDQEVEKREREDPMNGKTQISLKKKRMKKEEKDSSTRNLLRVRPPEISDSRCLSSIVVILLAICPVGGGWRRRIAIGGRSLG